MAKLVPICVSCESELDEGLSAYSCGNRACECYGILQRNPPLGESHRLFTNCVRQLPRSSPQNWKLTQHDRKFLKSLKIAPE